MEGRRGVQSVEIGYRILRAVQTGGASRTLKEIASETGMTASAVNNYLVSLQRTGLVRSGGRGSYSIGPSALSLGLAALRQIDGFDIVRDGAMRLRDETGLTVTLCTWSDEGPVVVFKQDGPGYGPLDIRPGMLLTPLGSAAGRAFVASLDPSATRAVLSRSADADPAKEILQIRADILRRGFAQQDLYGHTAGYRACAAPIADDAGPARYVLTVLAPRASFRGSLAERHAGALLAAAREMTILLGGAASAPAPRARGGLTGTGSHP